MFIYSPPDDEVAGSTFDQFLAVYESTDKLLDAVSKWNTSS